MKKKIIAISLITIIVICNSITVWAADRWSGNGNYSVGGAGGTDNADRLDSTDVNGNSAQKDVKGTVSLTSSGTTYNVTIEWGSLAYNATPEEDKTLIGTWNPAGYYDVGNFGSWEPASAGANIITVTNNSNGNISSNLIGNIEVGEGSELYNKFGITQGVIGFLGDGESELLDSAASTDPEKDIQAVHLVEVQAPIIKSPELLVENITLGTVTVRIAIPQ